MMAEQPISAQSSLVRRETEATDQCLAPLGESRIVPIEEDANPAVVGDLPDVPYSHDVTLVCAPAIDMMRVKKRNGVTAGREDRERLATGQWRPSLALKDVVQGFVAELHRAPEVGRIERHARIDNPDHVRVPGLEQLCQGIFAVGRHLDRDGRARLRIFGAQHETISSGTEYSREQVVTKNTRKTQVGNDAPAATHGRGLLTSSELRDHRRQCGQVRRRALWRRLKPKGDEVSFSPASDRTRRVPMDRAA